MATLRCTDDPRMSARPYSGWTPSNTIGSISAAASGTVSLLRSMVLSTAFRKRHSTTGWMAVHFSLIMAWTRVSSSSTLRWTAMEKSGSTSSSFGRWVAFSSPGPGRDELQRADHLVLVVERRADEGAGAAGDQLVLPSRAVGPRREVVDDDGLVLDDGALVQRARELRRLVVRRVRVDAGVIVAHGVVQHEHAVALDRGQAQVQAGPAEQRPELGLEALEPRARHDRLLVDQVALERREHLLVRHVDGLERHESAQRDLLRGQEVAEQCRGRRCRSGAGAASRR